MIRSDCHTVANPKQGDDLSTPSLTSEEYELMLFIGEMMEMRVAFLQKREVEGFCPNPTFDVSGARAMIFAGINNALENNMDEETIKKFVEAIFHSKFEQYQNALKGVVC